MEDLDHELANRNFKIISGPDHPSEGARVAMVEHNGAPVELIKFNNFTI